MACADCIGQNSGGTAYIFVMRARLLLPGLFSLAGALLPLRADPADVESSHDYPGFPRLPGFVISDFDEDNPAEYDFPVARPLPIDSDHVETVDVKGHRFVIRYEPGAGVQAPALLQTQQYYEKLAAAAGFTVEKTGAVGDVSETFHQARAGHDVWVHLEPSGTIEVLTIVESSAAAPPPVTAPASVPGDEDPLYTALNKDGRVVLPLTFLPGKADLDADSQPMIDRVVAILAAHPDLLLRIEGHTDNTGDPQDNVRLSVQRAVTVRGMLIAAHVDKKRIEAVGQGGAQPLADDNTAEGREKNRRIELVVPKDSAGFHASAPNGMNYYPGASGSSQ